MEACGVSGFKNHMEPYRRHRCGVWVVDGSFLWIMCLWLSYICSNIADIVVKECVENRTRFCKMSARAVLSCGYINAIV